MHCALWPCRCPPAFISASFFFLLFPFAHSHFQASLAHPVTPALSHPPCDACIVSSSLRHLHCPIPPVSTPSPVFGLRRRSSYCMRLSTPQLVSFLFLLLFLHSLLSPSMPASLSPSLMPHPHPHWAASTPPAPTYRVDSRTLGQCPRPRLHTASMPPHARLAPLLLCTRSMHQSLCKLPVDPCTGLYKPVQASKATS